MPTGAYGSTRALIRNGRARMVYFLRISSLLESLGARSKLSVALLSLQPDSDWTVSAQACGSIEISAVAGARLRRQAHASARFSRTTIIKTVLPALHERCFAFGASSGLARCVLCAFTACRKSTFVLGRKAGKIDGIRHLRRIVRTGAQGPGRASREERAKHYQHGNSHGGNPLVSGECKFGTRNEREQRACPERRRRSSRIKRLRI